MKVKKINNLIESGNEERKNKSWQVVSGQIAMRTGGGVQANGSRAAVLRRPKIYIFAGAALALCIALVVFFCLYDFAPNNAMPETRFYSDGEYNTAACDSNLKQYSEQNGLDIYYFDWYGQTEYFYDIIYTDSGTGEIICFEEIIASESGDLITLFVAESGIKLDFFDTYAVLCAAEYAAAANITVYYGGNSGIAYAMFEFENYSYYLNIPYLEEVSDILIYVDTLLAEWGNTAPRQA